jgi:CPA1 family monovalent cation:H+ antiporter
VLLARALAVGVPSALLGRRFGLPARAGRVLTWGGLRGGISVALALSLPPGPARDQVVTLTYAVVVFSILVQGLTIGGLVRRTWPAGAGAAAAD